jgi:chorismate mutase/prephenate dehydratase
VVAVENSLEGAVAQTLDLFIESSVTICAEVFMEITHSFLSREKSLDTVKRVYSHPQAIAQCRPWLRRNVPWAALKESESTSSAAMRL